MLRLGSLACGALLVVASADAQPVFSRYVALGDSYMAGVVSNALVETHQQRSIPALIARQAGVAVFQQPLVSEPGIPAELTLMSLGPGSIIAPKAATPGTPRNAALAASYNNLAVPNSSLADLQSRAADSGGMHDLVLRGKGTALAQATAQRPTFVTLWIGNDEILAAVLRGRAIEGQTLTPTETFRGDLQNVIKILRGIGATVVVGNILDLTAIPFASTLKPYVVDPATGEAVLLNGSRVPLLGPSGPLTDGTLVTLVASPLLAQGTGVPVSVGGKGTPLPDEAILDAAEQAQIRVRVTELNRVITDVCQAARVPVVNMNGFYTDFLRRGRYVGGIQLSNAFLSGGFWSYDGMHPNELGYAIVANEWIAAINDAGGSVAPVSLAGYLASERTPTSTLAPFPWSIDAQLFLRDMYARRP
jgi:lysophospholipase L1-like esterase